MDQMYKHLVTLKVLKNHFDQRTNFGQTKVSTHTLILPAPAHILLCIYVVFNDFFFAFCFLFQIIISEASTVRDRSDNSSYYFSVTQLFKKTKLLESHTTHTNAPVYPPSPLYLHDNLSTHIHGNLFNLSTFMTLHDRIRPVHLPSVAPIPCLEGFVPTLTTVPLLTRASPQPIIKHTH